MANDFAKQELMYFDKFAETFDKDLDLSMKVSHFTPETVSLERSRASTYQRRMPQIADTVDGFDISGETPDDLLDRFVPGQVNTHKNTLFVMDAKELRDPIQMEEAVRASRQQLAAQIEVSVANKAALEAGIVVKRNALTGYDDLAEAESRMNERGIRFGERPFVFNTRDNAAVASNLAARQTINSKPTNAIERSEIGNFAGFNVSRTDLLPTIAAGSSATITVNGAVTAHTVTAMTSDIPTDNRYQTFTASASHGLVVGDAIQFDGVNQVHTITKQDTGKLATFRVYAVATNEITVNAMVVTGPYQNVTAVPADGAAVTVLNNVATQANVFWAKDSIELAKGSIDTSTMNGAGMAVRTMTTPQGIQLVMAKQANIRTFKVETRIHVYYGVTVLDPCRCGILLANQTGSVN